MLVEQSSGPLDAFSKLASVRPGRRPAAHRRAQGGSFRSEAFLFARGLGGKGSLQAEGAAGGRELVFKGLAPPGRTSRRLAALGSARGHDSRLSGPRDIRRQQNGTFSGFPGLATSVGARKARFRARTARSGPKRPEPRSGKPGIVPKRRLKPFRGSESPGTRQRSSQDGPSRTAPIRQRPKGAPPISRERGRFEFGVALRAPFCGPSSRSALRGPGGEAPPASGTKGLSLCPTSPAP